MDVVTLTLAKKYTDSKQKPSPEDIQQAVNEYLEENPVQAGATQEEHNQIYENKDDIEEVKEDLNDLDSRLSESIDEISNDVQKYVSDTVIETKRTVASKYENRILGGTGASTADTTRDIVRYTVQSGNIYHISVSADAEYTFQFNNGTSPQIANLRGKVNKGAFDGYVIAPADCTYLLVCQSKTNSTNSVSLCRFKTDDISIKLTVTANNYAEVLPDLNDVNVNAVYNVAGVLQSIQNIPQNTSTDATVVTMNGDNARNTSGNLAFTVQYLYDIVNSKAFVRFNSYGLWGEWIALIGSKAFTPNLVEFSAFNTFGIIGDSLSVGAFRESDGTTAHSRHTDGSWGNFIAKRCFNTAKWFGFSGATAKTWISKNGSYTDDNGRVDRVGLSAVLDISNKCDAYVLAFGFNDSKSDTLGSMADIVPNYEDNADTFYGNMDRIIRAINSAYPNAHIFVLTNPRMNRNNAELFNQAVRDIVNRYSPTESDTTKIHLIDLYGEYNDIYTSWDSLIWQTHYTAPIYFRMGEILGTAFSNYMREHPFTFRFLNE